MDYLFDPAFFRFRISTCHEMSVVPGGAIAPRPVGRFPIVVLQSDVDAVDEAVRNRRATDEVVFLQKKIDKFSWCYASELPRFGTLHLGAASPLPMVCPVPKRRCRRLAPPHLPSDLRSVNRQ